MNINLSTLGMVLSKSLPNTTVITKSQSLVPVIRALGKEVWDKFGRSTTWMDKLLPRVEGGGGGGCPLLVIGITAECIHEAQG